MLFTNNKSITRPKTRTEDDGKDSREHEKQLLWRGILSNEQTLTCTCIRRHTHFLVEKILSLPLLFHWLRLHHSNDSIFLLLHYIHLLHNVLKWTCLYICTLYILFLLLFSLLCSEHQVFKKSVYKLLTWHSFFHFSNSCQDDILKD